MSIVFSKELSEQVRQTISIHAQELGEDGLDGVEEVIGDYLTGFAREEFTHLIDVHGFNRVSTFVKAKYF